MKSALQPRQDAEVLLFGQLRRLVHHLDPQRIDRVGFLDEDVLPRFDAGLHVHRMELGRASDQHDVNRLDHLLVAVQPVEAMIVVHLDLVGLLRLERIALSLHAVQKDIGHGYEPHSRIGIHGIGRGAGAAAAATDHADSNHVAAGRMGRSGQRQSRHACADGRGTSHKIATGQALLLRGLGHGSLLARQCRSCLPIQPTVALERLFSKYLPAAKNWICVSVYTERDGKAARRPAGLSILTGRICRRR